MTRFAWIGLGVAFSVCWILTVANAWRHYHETGPRLTYLALSIGFAVAGAAAFKRASGR